MGGKRTPKQGLKQVVQRRRVKVRAEQGYVRSRVPDSCKGLRLRAMVMAFVLSLGFAGLGMKIGYVALVPPHEPRLSVRSLPPEPVRRGNIYDYQGTLLATTLQVPSVYADPKRVLDVEETARKLARALPDVTAADLVERFSHPRRRFVWVRRKVTPTQAFAVHNMGLPGVGFRYEQVRLYPQQSLAAHVLGGINIDGRGVAGIEASFNKRLQEGQDVYLTLDSRVQQQLTETLRETMNQTESRAAWGVVLDATTGDVRALAAVPDYDVNRFGEAPNQARFNPVTFGRYEMGSTLKLLTLAQGLRSGVITTETQIDCRKPLRVGKYTIKDFHPQERVLTATEVLRHSSNIGAAQIADAVGAERQRAFFSEFGLLDTVDVGLPETTAPLYPARWGRIHTMTIGFGHGIAVTPLQLVAAVATLATDGVYRPPRLVMHLPHGTPRRVMEPAVVQQVKYLMRDVVDNGSGWRARMAGFDVGGKTGTAEKVGAGGYADNKNLVSFVGAVPLENPKFVALVMVDEPKKGYETGGRAAAPAFKKFVARAAPVMAMAREVGLQKRLATAPPRPRVTVSKATRFIGEGKLKHAAVRFVGARTEPGH
jgi:cell division protein FtsI (penicillin-binding protein 3)